MESRQKMHKDASPILCTAKLSEEVREFAIENQVIWKDL